MEHLARLYPDHINELQKRTRAALERSGFEALAIHGGQQLGIFLDDNQYPFKVNSHFKQWLPVIDNPHCWVIANGVDKPKLLFFRPVDFWHKVADVPSAYWAEAFEIVLIDSPEAAAKALPHNKGRVAYLGEHLDYAKSLGFSDCNPGPVLNYLHYHRAYKTEWEQACMRKANAIAVKGHLAAKAAFLAGASEFAINQAYLSATEQGENDLPYGNIVALNRNGAILHYMHFDRQAKGDSRSFLIDAGASFNGFAADITRTYAREDNAFAELIAAVTELEKSLVAGLKPGLKYAELHHQCHLGIAGILKDFGLIRCDAETSLATGINRAFFPHGLGHHLGLQVHDVGGFMANDYGDREPAPAKHPFLRTTRTVEAGNVLTIEPGLYFIDSLLEEVQAGAHSELVNWEKVESFKPFGGIRIEDDVIVHRDGVENMTRKLGLA
ncbi:MAG: Xaa-Pro dipeptidase [Pseudomonadota bacterium]|uniref:Xaa-Pro dipeptidase n=1 Tax=Gallaecimonas pentaromativorans TaxID=584787 RepID=UPI00067E87AF|nr:Xaa-Pro dipeptidase [Gallaecimonas pentaromativorans]MED5523142.1 Xaa-Pro dipeptidase [Pseudomonadota bacterium]